MAKKYISAVSLVAPDYDPAIAFYTGALGFDLVEDTRLSGEKRWVLLSPPGSRETRLLIAKAATPEQQAVIGAQAGGRVFLFLETDDFDRDYQAFQSKGVRFTEAPRDEPYGRVAVFEDPFGNRWDLIESRRKR